MFNPLDSISQISVKLLLSEPFYGHFMMGLSKEVSKKTKTVAIDLSVNDTMKLIVNRDFWYNLSENHRYGLIKHEMLHIVLKHLFAMKNYANKKVFNIAADLVVNQYILPKQLQNEALTISKFSYLEYQYGIKLKYNQDVGYYYKMLSLALKEEEKCDFKSACLSCNGGGKKSNNNQINLNDLMKDDCGVFESHKFWNKLNEFSEGQCKLIAYQCNSLIVGTLNRLRQKTRNFGNLPLGLVTQLELILETINPQFNWRRMLRLFGTISNSTYIKNTIRRPSKRYGTVPGIKIKRRNKLLIVIDTSASINMSELEEFYKELYYIWRQGAQIRVVDCDTKIAQYYDYKGVTPKKVLGGGGTDFNAPIIYGNTEYRPDGMIYFTDGFAKKPKVLPRYPMLWVISSEGIKPTDNIWEELPGKVLKLN